MGRRFDIIRRVIKVSVMLESTEAYPYPSVFCKEDRPHRKRSDKEGRFYILIRIGSRVL